MSWHVIVTFIGMRIIGLSLRHKGIEMGLHVCANRWVGILIQDEAGRGMQYKSLKHSGLQFANLPERRCDFICDEMKTSCSGPESNVFLEEFHTQ